MAAGKPRSNYEEIRVTIEQTERKVLPAVELEKKEIRLKTAPGSKVPSIVMSTFDDSKSGNADGIVGSVACPHSGDTSTNGILGVPPEELGPEAQELTLQTPSSPKLGSRLTVEQATSVMEKTENLIDFFQDQENSQAFSKSKAKARVKKPRTPSPSSVRQSVGLDQLDTLVCLMEQLGTLRDENSRLKHRCDFLESTKTLLQAKTSLEEEDPFLAFDSNSLPRQKKQKSQSQKSSHSDGGGIRTRPRLPSAEDAMDFELELDSSGDHLSRRPNKLHKRSFSTGSLEVPSDITEQSGEDDLGSESLSESYDKVMKRVAKAADAKQKSKFSKWAKVKKVLTSGQQITDTIGSGIKTIKGKGASYFRYGVAINRDLSVPNVAESRSVDSGVGSGVEADLTDVRKSTSSGEPPSPTRFIERHIDVPTPQIDDDSVGIWLGPPEWIEKEREKELELLKQALSESPKSESGDLGSPLSVSGFEEEGEKFLQVPLPRRQSSPVLGDDDENTGTPAPLHRSSSYKEDDQLEKEDMFHKGSDKDKKKSTWGRMKHMMHTRKDSVQKTRRKGDIDLEESSEVDNDAYEDLKYDYLEGPVSRSTPKASPIVFRDKTRDKSSSRSPPGKSSEATKRSPPTSSGSVDVTALLGGVSDEFTRKLQEWDALRDKGKRSSGLFKESPEFSEGVSHDSAGAVSPEFLKKLEEWEKVKTLKGSSIAAVDKKRDSQISQDADGDSSSDGSADGMSTPPTDPSSHGLSINMEEMQRKLTDSFSRKMQEWEKQKYRSQTSEKELKSSVKSDRPKSKKSKEEKEKEKYEKLREREILRVERQEQKLEREKIRLEKERLKSLEREAKIEKMKGRLSQPDMESKFKNPILGPLTEYKVTTDFARKLHEWEVKKGKDVSTAMYLEAQSRSLQFSTEYQNGAAMLGKNEDTGNQDACGIPTDSMDTDGGQRKTSSESEEMFLLDEENKVEESRPRPGGRGQRPSPIKLIPCFDSPELSPGGPGMSDDSSLDDHTTATTESMTQANILSLEKANFRLLEELHQKEREYNSLQTDVRALSQQLASFKAEHSMELELYKQQVLEGLPPSPNPGSGLETHQLAGTLALIEDKIAGLQKFGEHLAMSMEGAAVGKFQTVEGEESINGRLVDLLDKMKGVLLQASGAGENTIEEVTRKSSALHNFEKLYSQAMQLQVQMNNLRVSQLERNKEILNMKRHLLVQEANNLRLQADVTRREAELLHYKEYSQKRIPIKRWNTYSGKEDRQQMVNGSESPHRQTVFQRVQRLRSARAPMSSTTDSDSDTPNQGVRKERTKATDSPRSRKKESPRLKKRESPRLKKKESPKTKRTESPRYIPSTIPELSIPERSIERHEEHVRSRREIIRPRPRDDSKTGLASTTVTLPTAKVTLPKDISVHEVSGVPKRAHISEQSPKQRESKSSPSAVKSHKELPADRSIDTQTEVAASSKRSETKFPELLIPEWKKAERGSLHRTPCVEPDEVFDDVFLESEKQTITEQKIMPQKAVVEQLVLPQKAKIEETSRHLDASFESSASEDTLKYLSPDASPAPKVEPPHFPRVVDVILKTNDRGKSMSDPGYSRQRYVIKVPLEKPLSPILPHKHPIIEQTCGQGIKLNIPVIPLRRIKPAQELLEDSKKYRSGHSICLTRILKRYPMKIECRSRSMDENGNPDKELTSIRSGFVRTMARQISRESTSDQKTISVPQASSSPQVLRKDSKSEFVQYIVQQMSEPCEQAQTSTPVIDLTNDGQVRRLKNAFNSGTAGSPDSIRKFSETEKGGYKSGMVTGQGSDEVLKLFESGSSTSTLTFSQLSTKSDLVGKQLESNISANINYVSMPMLSLESDDQEGRERSATTSGSSSQQYHYTQKESPSLRHRVHVAVSMSPGRTRRVIDPTLSPPRLRRLMGPVSPGRQRRILEPSPIDQVVMEDPLETTLAHSQLSQSETKAVKRRSPKMRREEMGTIGILCRQSLTFDLGVSQGIEESGIETGTEASAATFSIRHSTSSTTSTSSQSELDNVSHTSSTKEKKKSKHKFLESSFIQKSRRFFKVSK